jgi:RNA polymerase sigma-54 factor
MEAPSFSLTPQVELRMNAALIASMELLALPLAELEELVEQELAENPALERLDEPGCRSCGAPLERGRCLECERRRPDDRDVAERAGAAEQTLAETLLEELRLQLPKADQRIASYLVGCLDEHGFLDTDIEEAAAALSVTPGDVERVLSCLRQTAGPGVGAHDVRECLLLQLGRASLEVADYELARSIVSDHLDDLAHGRYAAIARAAGVDRERVVEMRELIRAQLRPFPILPDPQPWSRPTPQAPPEVAVRAQTDGRPGYAVEVLERRRIALNVSPAYLRLDPAELSHAEREVVDAQVESARAFVERLERRWSTISRVVQHLVERQHEFVEHGPRELLPLTRREVAAELGLHESTVGRAVAGRHAILPSRRVVALSEFFEGAAGARDALREAVAGERRPLSDAELVGVLAHEGFDVSRRTVAKYRAQLGIPAHAHR